MHAADSRLGEPWGHLFGNEILADAQWSTSRDVERVRRGPKHLEYYCLFIRFYLLEMLFQYFIKVGYLKFGIYLQAYEFVKAEF